MSTDHGPVATPPEELAQIRRRCWAPECNRTSRLDWCGWKYCLRHYWTYVLRDAEHKWVKIRFTRFVSHRRDRK